MAEQTPLAVVGFVLENLKDSILYNSNLIGRLDDKIKKLVDDLDLLKAFASEYSQIDTDRSDADVQKLAKDVRDVVYQAEDAIEDYIVFQTLWQKRGFGYRALRLFSQFSDLRHIGKQIQDVRDIVAILIKDWTPTSGTSEAQKETAVEVKLPKKKKKVPVVEEDYMVGFEDAAASVIELLTGGSHHLEIVSIIGMFWLGKTTLAKKVLSDPIISFLMFLTVFVNVSPEYNRKEVFINILRALKCTTTPDMNDDELAKKLCEELSTNKYLIVMDDVSSASAWDELKVAFPNNNNGSRVLITSQDKRVASRASPSKDPYYLRFMTDFESRELLRRIVFRENEIPDHLQGYALRILQICCGLPLAIVLVAGILLNHRERTEWWENVVESVGAYVSRDYTHEPKEITLIELSFNHLPYHLKACYLYLGVFGEDFEIPVWKLLRLWIAEGFIQKDGNMTLEDVAEEYLEDLVDRRLVMVGQRRLNGRIKTCRINKTFRGFCVREALRQNLFVEFIRFDQSTISIQHPNLHSYRRICVNRNAIDYVASKPSGNRVRSFLMFPKEETAVPPDHASWIPKAFKLLRVLEMNSLKFTIFPDELYDLVLLKYIAICCDFKIIPKNFSNLRNLQTVIIDTTSDTLEIAADISKLALLMHLQTNASTSLGKCKRPSVANPNLHTLCTISPESCTTELFERYPNLQKLGIRGKLATVILEKGESALFKTLAKLELLENLKLINDKNSPLRTLPRETNFPRNLRELTLMDTFLDWTQISSVGRLQDLEVLKLKDNAFDGELWDTEDGGFRCLKVLLIGHTKKLVRWKANASHFPMLTSLYLRHCDNLEAIPLGIASIPSLETIDLYYCTKPSVAVSARKIQVLKLKALRKNKISKFKLVVCPRDE